MEGESSFLLRTLTNSRGPAKPKATQYGKLTRIVTDTEMYQLGRKSVLLIWKWRSAVSWVVGTTVLVLVFPLWLSIGRELDLGQLEQEMMLGYQARGYPPQQLQAMQAQGQFGVPPMPPPQQPQFP